MTFRPRYLIASVALFAALVLIALFVRDAFVRPFLGDVLAVVWLYLTARAFIDRSPRALATGALVVAYLVEFAQYFGAADALGLEHGSALRVVLGSTFDPLDLLAYTLGWLLSLSLAAQGSHKASLRSAVSDRSLRCAFFLWLRRARTSLPSVGCERP